MAQVAENLWRENAQPDQDEEPAAKPWQAAPQTRRSQPWLRDPHAVPDNTVPAGAAGASLASLYPADDDEEDFDPNWCVDNGDGIVVMTTLGIVRGLRAGKLAGDLKVWRDGMPNWLRLEEVVELRPLVGDDAFPDSHIRRRQADGVRALSGAGRGEERQASGPRALVRSVLRYLLVLIVSLVVGFVLTGWLMDAPPARGSERQPQLRSASGVTAARCRAALLPLMQRRGASRTPGRSWLDGSERQASLAPRR